MEYILTIGIITILLLILKIGLNLHIKDIKKIKEIGYDKKLKFITDKFPSNKIVCEAILKKLNNNTVTIEEDSNTKSSLYIAVTNKIIIANISDTFTRIQTIAHECLHSIQNRKMLLFNFIFSNILILYFLLAIPLIIFNVLGGYIFVQIYMGMGVIAYIIKAYLENDAMTKAFFVAKEYMQEYRRKKQTVLEEEEKIILNKMEELNNIGIPYTNFYLIFGIMVKVIILCTIGLIISL